MIKSNVERAQSPQKRVVFYRERSGRVPVLRWLEGLPKRHRAKCMELIRRLQLSDGLQFPHTRYLRGGIHELRARCAKVRYRLFYFWHADAAAVIVHGIVKKTGAVPNREIGTAHRRKTQFEANPHLHTGE